MRITRAVFWFSGVALIGSCSGERDLAGESCGNDCRFEHEAWCGQCGELIRNEDGVCRPQYCGAIPECEEEGPAQQGELCGEQWWCKRACAADLECAPDPCLADDWRGRCWRPEDVPVASECPDAAAR